MRRFLVGTCCVIVALQVLVGVPLAVCIGFFSMIPHRTLGWQTDGGYVSTVAYAPSPCTTSCPTSWDSPQPPPIVSPPMAAPMIPNSLVAASPVFSDAKASAETADEFVATFKQVAEAETGVTVPPASETEASCHCENALVDSLSEAVTHLYEQARSLEADGSYGRADQIRDLARSIREEIHIIHRDHAPPADPPACATATAPPTVTEAPFNPEPPPAPQDAASSFDP